MHGLSHAVATTDVTGFLKLWGFRQFHRGNILRVYTITD